MSKLINKTFQSLRCEGYFAAQDWACCQSCGWADVNGLAADPEYAVFYHAQDADDLRETGMRFLSRRGDGTKICKTLNRAGVGTEWDGKDNHRIRIMPSDVIAEMANENQVLQTTPPDDR